MGRARSHWSREEDERALSLRSAGWSHIEIGEDLGRTARAVGMRLSRLIPPLRPRKHEPRADGSPELARLLRARGWVVHPPGWLARRDIKPENTSTCPLGTDDECDAPEPLRPPVRPHADISYSGVLLWH
jgi:hypothetical protein